MIVWPLAALVLLLGVLALPIAAHAESPARIPRIGYLVLSPLADPPNITIEYRSASWNRELLSDLATELVDRKVDVIVAVPGAIEATREATKAIPIIVPALIDPVEEGLVTSLARPGGNLTGTGWSTGDLVGKRLELLKETLPVLSRVAVLWNPAHESAPRQWQEVQAAGRKLRVTLESLEVRDPSDVPGALVDGTAEAVEIPRCPLWIGLLAVPTSPGWKRFRVTSAAATNDRLLDRGRRTAQDCLGPARDRCHGRR